MSDSEEMHTKGRQECLNVVLGSCDREQLCWGDDGGDDGDDGGDDGDDDEATMTTTFVRKFFKKQVASVRSIWSENRQNWSHPRDFSAV